MGLLRSFQITNIFPNLTVMENLVIHGQLHGMTAKSARKQAVHWSEVMDFREYLGSYPDKLSFGHQRRVCFARTLLHDPEVILLPDEPYRFGPPDAAELGARLPAGYRPVPETLIEG